MCKSSKRKLEIVGPVGSIKLHSPSNNRYTIDLGSSLALHEAPDHIPPGLFSNLGFNISIPEFSFEHVKWAL